MILPPPLARRDFLRRVAQAGAAAAAVGGSALWLLDVAGPAASGTEAACTVPDFSLPEKRGRLSIVTGSERTKTLNRALAALGGIEGFITPGDRVVLKVNAAFASPPSLGATTHPELVAECARLCLKAGAASVTVTDNPINEPASCFALSGIAKAAEAAGAQIELPRPGAFRAASLKGGRLIRNWPLFFEPLRRATKLIGLSPVKDHHRSGASMAMKNWYGLVGGQRNLFHQDIHDFILELATLFRPTLVILDGTTSMIANGPTGGSLEDLKTTNTMIVSTDQVAADAFGATLLGKSAPPTFVSKAAAAGLGVVDYETLKPARDHVD